MVQPEGGALRLDSGELMGLMGYLGDGGIEEVWGLLEGSLRRLSLGCLTIFSDARLPFKETSVLPRAKGFHTSPGPEPHLGAQYHPE